VDVGDVDEKAEKLLIPVDLSEFPSNEKIAEGLLSKVPKGVHPVLIDFISRLYAVYVDCQFTYLEINPLVAIPNADKTSAEVHFLDLAAKIDQTAEFECGVKWAIARSPAALGIPVVASKDSKVTIDAGPPLEFPAPFGREMSKEEAYIAEMDAKTGASLKLTILNSQGRVWTLVAGGGASVVYADAIASAGFASELANYGEYSGAPTETQTFHYARTVFDLMLRAPQHPEGKILFIGGGIANFTNVRKILLPSQRNPLTILHRSPAHSRVSSAPSAKSHLFSTSTRSRSGSVARVPTTRRVSRTSRPWAKSWTSTCTCSAQTCTCPESCHWRSCLAR
jgi:ATP citrate (pro-S)-lyase